MVFGFRPMANDTRYSRRLASGAGRLTAIVMAVALAVAPLAARAQDSSKKKGPRLLRDTEIEQ